MLKVLLTTSILPQSKEVYLVQDGLEFKLIRIEDCLEKNLNTEAIAQIASDIFESLKDEKQIERLGLGLTHYLDRTRSFKFLKEFRKFLPSFSSEKKSTLS